MKIFAFISIAVTCVVLHSVHGKNFECNDEPAVCKTKFGTEFEKDFKELHLNSIRKLATAYIDKTTAVKSQLSDDDPHSKSIEESINIVRKSLKKLNDNVNDNEKIGEAVEEAMRGMTWDLTAPEAEHFKELIEAQNVRESLIDILRQLGRDAGNLWAGMYSGLRENDLKAYPEYEEVNEFMENLRGNGKNPATGNDYRQAAEILANRFHLSYFQIIDFIS